MIRVLKNGVPLAAVVSVEFHRAFVDRYLDRMFTTEEISKLRADFLAQWPEVAAFLAKK